MSPSIRHLESPLPRLFVLMGLLALGLLSIASQAAASPQFKVNLERDQLLIGHSDERVDYTVNVQNIASVGGPPEVGSALFCNGAAPAKHWFRDDIMAYQFSYQWVRNGVDLESPEDLAHGSQTDTYVVQPTDEHKALQCVIKGTNDTGTGSFLNTTQPVTVVGPSPLPAIEPPKPNEPFELSRRPSISGTAGSAGDELSCVAPTAGWSASNALSPITWTFKWFRNGAPATSGVVTETTATSSKFKIAASELTTKAVFQCMATATNISGSSTVIESSEIDTSAPAPTFVEGTSDTAPFGYPEAVVESGNSTSGDVTVKVELPGGEETFAYKVVNPAVESQGPGGWTCATVAPSGVDHAKAICSRSDSLAPGASYPPFKVIVGLGADAPDVAIAKATVSGGGAPASATAEDEFTFAPALPFGLNFFEAKVTDDEGHDYTQAGGHPFAGVAHFQFNKKRTLVPANTGKNGPYAPIAHVKQVITDLPRGFVGNALAVPELCSGIQAVLTVNCPPGSIIGGIEVILNEAAAELPIYAIKPEFGTPAQFAFPDPLGNAYTLSTRLRPQEGYAVSLELAPAPKIAILGSNVIICDFGGVKVGPNFDHCKKADEAGANPKPLFSNPTRCAGPPPFTRVLLGSWEQPAAPPQEVSFTTSPITGCEAVPFDPQMEMTPSSHDADSPTGLEVELTMPTDGLEERQGISQANLKSARVTFPEGMAVNPTAGQGLGACTAAQVKLKTDDPIECPESSKIGTVEIETPLIEDPLKGNVYVAKQGAVDGALIGLYLVFDSPKNGILIKVPGRVVFDQRTGQMTTVIDESPEAPFSAVRIHFAQGPRSPLLTPPKCGTYQITSQLAPWNAQDPDNPTASERVTQTSSFEIDHGPNGGPCPSGGLDAKLSAGTEDPVAGKTSPFNFDLSREDGSERFSALDVHTPPGLSAYIKGIPYCSDATLASIPTVEGTGQAQVDHPSCPARSQIGVASAGAGAGADPLFVDTGRVYLAGPYKGAPLSFAVVAPAVAGPLDLGNVVVRTAIHVDPETARISAVSDPVPTILHGLLLDIRDIRVSLNRPNFTLNPTNCEPLSVGVDVKGAAGGSASLSNPFQVGGCERLGFKPKLTTTLSGSTKRAGHPSLKGVLVPRPGDANLKSAVVTIPRSEFLDQAHIRTICTRVQFAANACPKGSIYGKATAITPLLDQPLSGPVYLRSSSHKLPDLVVAVKGPDSQPIEAAVVGRIDSIKGQIRANFEATPDVPLTKVTIQMQGGKKGLLINSRDLCSRSYRASIALEAHNGLASEVRPVLRNRKCRAGRKAKAHHGPPR